MRSGVAGKLRRAPDPGKGPNERVPLRGSPLQGPDGAVRIPAGAPGLSPDQGAPMPFSLRLRPSGLALALALALAGALAAAPRLAVAREAAPPPGVVDGPT